MSAHVRARIRETVCAYFVQKNIFQLNLVIFEINHVEFENRLGLFA